VLIPALLAPDLSILGYLAGPRVGAVTYNLVHNWALPVGFALLAIVIGELWPLLAATALAAHVGWGRALGYGLKLPTGFKETHLGRIGRDRSGRYADGARLNGQATQRYPRRRMISARTAGARPMTATSNHSIIDSGMARNASASGGM